MWSLRQVAANSDGTGSNPTAIEFFFASNSWIVMFNISLCFQVKNVGRYNKTTVPAYYGAPWGGSPGQVVIERDSYSEGRGFKSQHCILDGHFFTFVCCKKINVCLKKMKINELTVRSPSIRLCNVFSFNLFHDSDKLWIQVLILGSYYFPYVLVFWLVESVLVANQIASNKRSVG